MDELQLYVPMEHSRDAIAPKSAVVGKPVGGDRIEVDYEGNIYGSSTLNTFRQKVVVAAGRAIARYPTVARRWMQPENLVWVGSVRFNGNGEPEFFIEEVDIHEEWINYGRRPTA